MLSRLPAVVQDFFIGAAGVFEISFAPPLPVLQVISPPTNHSDDNMIRNRPSQ